MCGDEKAGSEYSIGLGYLKSNCENKNIKIDIIKNREDLKDCDLIGLSAVAANCKEAIDILNSTNIPVVIGGQCTLWKGLEGYDFRHIVKGEGEIAFSKILKGEYVSKVVEEELIDDIDNIRYPYRGKIDKILHIFTARGCPYSCKYCSSSKFWKRVRFHSPEYVINEIEENILLSDNNIEEIYILDDLFAVNEERVKSFYDIWMRKYYRKSLKFKCFIRVNSFTENMARMMKEMQFSVVRFGGESGSNRILKILGKNTTVEQQQKVIDICNKYRLPVSGSYMYNIPCETEEDIEMTKSFINRNKGKMRVDGWYNFKAFPGTEYYSGENILEEDMSVRVYNKNKEGYNV
jgi:radical SAM superfamily enzyme YgiQ (UPF0313 family)